MLSSRFLNGSAFLSVKLKFCRNFRVSAAANCRGCKKFVQRLQKAFNLFFDLFIFELIESGKNVFFSAEIVFGFNSIGRVEGEFSQRLRLLIKFTYFVRRRIL